MKRLVQRAGERLVGLVLPKVEAGACVPEFDQCCKKDYAHSRAGPCTRKKTSC